MNQKPAITVHPSAEVAPSVVIGQGTSVWKNSQIRENVLIGANCIISKDTYIDAGVSIGDNVKVQNGVSIYRGVVIEDGVFCGPHCTFVNDRYPRSITPEGKLKDVHDWQITPTLVKYGASIGAHATIVCGATIGRWSMIAAGAVVTNDVPDYTLVVGIPARPIGFVCPCGARIKKTYQKATQWYASCSACLREIKSEVFQHKEG